MRKRTVTSFIIAIAFIVMFMTAAFLLIADLQNTDHIKEKLAETNLILANYIESGNTDIGRIFDSVPENTRITYISSSGHILYDSLKDDISENHLYRKEIIEATKGATGTDIRVSASIGIRMVYSALMLDDGSFIRSAYPFSNFALSGNYIKYLATALFLVVLVSTIIILRLSGFLLEPIEELSFATDRIARGELSRRVELKQDEELARLSRNFNNMAERLETTIVESLEKQNRLEAILKSMDSGVIALDNNETIIMMNPFSKQLFSVRGDTLGMKIGSFPNLSSVYEYLGSDENVAAIRTPEGKDLKMKKADILGERMNKVGVVIVIQDITDIKRLENLRSQFVANVSHELKTPLTSIKGFSETLRFVNDEKTRIKFLDIINEEAERLTRLINDILSLSSLEQNREPKIEEIDTVEETRRICDMLHQMAVTKSIELTLTASGNPILMGDRDNYNQMVINLVDNAIKYTEPNGKVKVRIEKSGGKLILSVKDTGVGIPEEHLPRLFERFYRVDKSRDRAKGGTGLGLAIVKHIVLSMKGDIKVESEIGRGTTFTVSIPMD
ncbi:sensor histidine kinase [Youngiibacter multivorans]|uniref:histidine kinase n=1 Tax=Youngiibacter multivorans TaxID=937251 RepID=A0ABS4G683_9CLOT|nr:HAMP domain-containing sensor histidine kinase [Youngiibacter multivorans]MBP1920058.1 two-component system phosphate regulon sensor histidine kinase PhoR [Youngiibacter multivorans]